MFRRPLPDEIEERPHFSKVERIGGAVAHAIPLLIGIPLAFLLGNLITGLLPCPIIAYIISRSFRSRQLEWGAFQSLQATLMQLILVVTAFTATLFGDASRGTLFAGSGGFLIFLYTLWGAWDTAFGYDFRYIFISNLVDRITSANLQRQQRRQQRSDRSAEENGDLPPDSPR